MDKYEKVFPVFCSGNLILLSHECFLEELEMGDIVVRNRETLIYQKDMHPTLAYYIFEENMVVMKLIN